MPNGLTRAWVGVSGFRLALVVGVLLACVACSGETASSSRGGGGDADSSSSNTGNPPQNDVEVTTCEPGEFGLAKVRVRITNHSSKRSNYMLSVNLEDDAGTKVGEAFGASNNIEPGQSADEELPATASGTFTRCVVKNVERYAS